MEKMNISRFKIAGGNATSLVEGCPDSAKNDFSKAELNKVEQVGFVDQNGDMPILTMMGNELCVNGTLAFAKMLGNRSGELITSGINTPVRYRNSGELTSATFQMEPKVIRDRQIVLFEGIGYICQDGPTIPTASLLAELANEFKLPAFGIAGYLGDSLIPYVYVKEIDSIVAETACGSGSIALSLITGAKNITQVTGQRINVMRNGNQFTVSAKVVKMKGK